jgi:tetratricopeptide (TPR) repeat protein
MLLVAACLFLAGVLPSIGLVAYYFQATSTVADRYLYMGLLGPALAVAWVLERARERPPAIAAICVTVAALAVLAFMTESQDRVWRDSKSLYRQALAVNPDSMTASHNDGTVLARERRFSEAIPLLRRAVALAPANPDYRDDLAHALSDDARAHGERGDLDQAAQELQEAISIQPGFALAHAYLGTVRGQQGDWATAADEMTTLVRLQPDDPNSHFKLGLALAHLQRLADARAELEEALRLRPGFPPATAALQALPR